MGQKILVPVKVYMCDEACGEEPMSIKQIPENEDVEVDITGSSNSGKAFMVEDSCEDATECSSSFGYTGSGAENALSFSDAEVESQRCADHPSQSMCDDWFKSCERREKMMPKSLTIHWRRFIRPIRWRCKWIELQIKQLQSQARKYEKELAAYNYIKQLDFAHLKINDSNIKSVPRSGRMHRNNVMKRNRRKRVEEHCDQGSYMSNHSLFSYYEKKDCTVDTCLKDFRDVGLGVNDSNEELKLNDVWSSIEYEHIDNSLDDIIQQIESIQSQVLKLKTRTDMVISENCGKFCTLTQLGMPGTSDGLNHFDLKSTSFADNPNSYPFSFLHSSSQIQSKFHLGDLMPGTTNSPELNDQWEDIMEEVLVQNQAANEEWHDYKYQENPPLKRTNESIQEDKFISETQVSEPAPPENLMHNEHSTWLSKIPTSKRKRRKKRDSS